MRTNSSELIKWSGVKLDRKRGSKQKINRAVYGRKERKKMRNLNSLNELIRKAVHRIRNT